MTGSLAAFITPGNSLDAAIERVRLVEKLGYDAVYATQIAARDGLMALAAYAPHTTRIKLGTGVLPAFAKHPVALATEAATVDEISGGRLILGVGMAHRITMENWYAVDMAKPLSRFKEYVTILRDIFTTGGSQFEGEFYRTKFAFMGYAARADLPIYTASLSPNSLRFAGAAADGIVLWSCLPPYIRDVVIPNLRAGAEAAGRDPASIEVVAAIPCALADDVEAAKDALRRDFFVYMTLPFYRAALAGGGFQDELDAFDERLGAGDTAGARAAISDRLIATFAGIGDEAAVRAKIAEYRDAGVTTPAVGGISVPKEAGPGVEATLEAAAGA